MSNYLRWNSSLSASEIFANSVNHSYPHPYLDGVIYLSQLKDENRSALVLDSGRESYLLTPKGFNLRTSINEYGGKPFWLHGNTIVFSNEVDQCLYRQELSDFGASAPCRVSCEARQNYSYSYTDINPIGDELIIAIIERQYNDCGIENESFLGLIDLSSPDNEPIELHGQADFHSNLVFDPSRQRLAWVQWNHPNMPWDNTQLMLANINIDRTRNIPKFDAVLSDVEEVSMEPRASICQLIFASNGRLFFSADFLGYENGDSQNYWNIYAVATDCSQVVHQQQRAVAVTSDLREFGYPHWQFGNARIVQFDNERLLAIRSGVEFDDVVCIDQETYAVSIYDSGACHYDNLCSNGEGTALAMCLSRDRPPGISRMISPDTTFSEISPSRSILKGDELSVSEHIRFKCKDGKTAYGFYYAPVNSKYPSLDTNDCAPPLLVMVHGGPSARAYGSFDLQKQYWTQRGFAIFDVNHRGSSGYGRNFRDALYGAWGELDCADIIDGINYLVKADLVDQSRICIRGKSAGGFTVLRALTEYPQVFAAGACYYGIANLVTLASSTHKFEKYYTDRLIGEKFDIAKPITAQSKYFQRSPINKIHSLKSAMIVFQGSMDKVVPPTVANELVGVLNDLGLPHTYIEYADEAHGFKRPQNNIDALENEFKFYRSALEAKSGKTKIGKNE